ncbi:hypothetical protein RI054_03g17800 [Pseudoscourfieldia marina]
MASSGSQRAPEDTNLRSKPLPPGQKWKKVVATRSDAVIWGTTAARGKAPPGPVGRAASSDNAARSDLKTQALALISDNSRATTGLNARARVRAEISATLASRLPPEAGTWPGPGAAAGQRQQQSAVLAASAGRSLKGPSPLPLAMQPAWRGQAEGGGGAAGGAAGVGVSSTSHTHALAVDGAADLYSVVQMAPRQAALGVLPMSNGAASMAARDDELAMARHLDRREQLAKLIKLEDDDAESPQAKHAPAPELPPSPPRQMQNLNATTAETSAASTAEEQRPPIWRRRPKTPAAQSSAAATASGYAEASNKPEANTTTTTATMQQQQPPQRPPATAIAKQFEVQTTDLPDEKLNNYGEGAYAVEIADAAAMQEELRQARELAMKAEAEAEAAIASASAARRLQEELKVAEARVANAEAATREAMEREEEAFAREAKLAQEMEEAREQQERLQRASEASAVRVQELERAVKKHAQESRDAKEERAQIIADVEPFLVRPILGEASVQTDNLVTEGEAAVAHLSSPVAAKGYGRSTERALPAKLSPRRRRLSEADRRVSQVGLHTRPTEERPEDKDIAAAYAVKAEGWARNCVLKPEEIEKEVRTHPWAKYASLSRTAKQEFTVRETRKIAWEVLTNVVVPHIESRHHNPKALLHEVTSVLDKHVLRTVTRRHAAESRPEMGVDAMLEQLGSTAFAKMLTGGGPRLSMQARISMQDDKAQKPRRTSVVDALKHAKNAITKMKDYDERAAEQRDAEIARKEEEEAEEGEAEAATSKMRALMAAMKAKDSKGSASMSLGVSLKVANWASKVKRRARVARGTRIEQGLLAAYSRGMDSLKEHIKALMVKTKKHPDPNVGKRMRAHIADVVSTLIADGAIGNPDGESSKAAPAPEEASAGAMTSRRLEGAFSKAVGGDDRAAEMDRIAKYVRNDGFNEEEQDGWDGDNPAWNVYTSGQDAVNPLDIDA